MKGGTCHRLQVCVQGGTLAPPCRCRGWPGRSWLRCWIVRFAWRAARRTWLRVLAAGRACSGCGWRESCDSATVLGVGLAMGRGFIRPFRLGVCVSAITVAAKRGHCGGHEARGATLVPVAFGRAHVRRNAMPRRTPRRGAHGTSRHPATGSRVARHVAASPAGAISHVRPGRSLRPRSGNFLHSVGAIAHNTALGGAVAYSS